MRQWVVRRVVSPDVLRLQIRLDHLSRRCGGGPCDCHARIEKLRRPA